MAVIFSGCNRTPPPQAIPLPVQQSSATVAGQSREIPGLPVNLTVKQRSTMQIPGMDGSLSITIDDITRGQAMVTILGLDGATIAGPASMKVDEALSFPYGGMKYAARFKSLNNSLLGEDSAEIVVDYREKKVLSEAEKIEKLIAAIDTLKGATFVRNGQSYSTDDAVSHLRRKLDSAGQQIKTAKDFIDQLASKSSLTGEEYLIRMPDGKTIKSSDFLAQELEKHETSSVGK
jgi:hypothetical protein